MGDGDKAFVMVILPYFFSMLLGHLHVCLISDTPFFPHAPPTPPTFFFFPFSRIVYITFMYLLYYL